MKTMVTILWTLTGIILPTTGQTLKITYIGELQYSPTTSRSNYCNLLRTDCNIPIYKNGSLSAATLHLFKANKTRIIDDEMTFSNIEDSNMPMELAVLCYTQKIGNSSLSFGIYNVNEDYFNTPITSLFTNSSCGIFPTISMNYTIANYPLSGLGLHYSGQFNRINVKASLYNGSGYSGWNKKDNPFLIDLKNDGIFGITEFNYKTNYGIYIYGFSAHSHTVLHNKNSKWQYEGTQTNKKKKANFTWWLYTEQRLFKKSRHKVNLLLQYSENNYKTSYCKRYGGLGLTFEDISKSNHNDLGIIATGAHFNNNYEVDFETTYKQPIIDGFYIQPSVHLIKNKRKFKTALTVRFLYEINWNLRRKMILQ